MKEMLKKFRESRSCMIWLILFIASVLFLIFGKADFNGWSAFNIAITFLVVGANKAEQVIKGK